MEEKRIEEVSENVEVIEEPVVVEANEEQELKGFKKFWDKFKNTKFCQFFVRGWNKFKAKHPEIARFIVFFLSSNAVTIIQMLLQIILSAILLKTALVNINFQYLAVPGATNIVTGGQYFIFDFAAGVEGGGLAFFLATYITIAIAQVINFFLQRNVTFQSKSNPWIAAMWYFIAFVAITLISSALLGLYKKPIFDFFGASFEWLANIIVVIINCAISFWVFYPIFKVIFPNKDKKTKAQ
ncbi:MAG: GtrA family protein [Acholeplasmatales bacterium]|nr:GtrA family protein [Acholeplasmatales bacterium]